VRAEGVLDRRVLAAYWAVPRAGFVPPAAGGQANLDTPSRIPHGQVTTQPSLIATMVAALELRGSERVLEVGSGLGLQTAILALLARQAVSVECFADLAAQARANLAAAGLGRVTGGRLVHPVGPSGHEQVTGAFHKEAGRLITDTRLTPARFVPLVGTHGIPSPEGRGER
jgi:protein-L-isoaspartate(D-aspartate) O-methyltransferase